MKKMLLAMLLMTGCAECRWTSQRYVTDLGCKDHSYVLTEEDKAKQVKVQEDLVKYNNNKKAKLIRLRQNQILRRGFTEEN